MHNLKSTRSRNQRDVNDVMLFPSWVVTHHSSDNYFFFICLSCKSKLFFLMHFFLQVWLDADANVFLEINRSSSLVFLCFIYCVGWYLARLGRRITCNKCDLFKLHVNDI